MQHIYRFTKQKVILLAVFVKYFIPSVRHLNLGLKKNPVNI